jgi:PhnB protein
VGQTIALRRLSTNSIFPASVNTGTPKRETCAILHQSRAGRTFKGCFITEIQAPPELDWSGNPKKTGGSTMPSQAKSIPQGSHSVTPYLTLSHAARALDFYKRAFGAQELMRMDGPDGKIGHAEIKIGDSKIMLADEMPGGGSQSPQSLGGTTGGIFLYVDNVDTVFSQAVSAGAKAEAQPTDMFWGDRFGRLKDPFGHSWSIATHKEDVAPAEMEKRMKEFMSKQEHQTSSAR